MAAMMMMVEMCWLIYPNTRLSRFVSLNTALSPCSCVVIQDEEYNHTLGSLTPLDLLTHPIRCPDVAIVRSSGRFVVWLLSERTAQPRPAYAPRTHHLGPLR